MTKAPVVDIDGDRYTGRAIEIEQSVAPETILAAIEAAESKRESGECKKEDEIVHGTANGIAVQVPPPPPAYEHIRYIHDNMGLRLHTALAKVARTCGGETPYDEQLATARRRLDELPLDPPEREKHRTTRATNATEAEQLRERAATLRGRLQARREQGLETDELKNELHEVLAHLSEAETTATAAQQQLEQTQAALRTYRDKQEERFRLEDRIANLERKARASLVEQYEPDFRDQLSAIERALPDETPIRQEDNSTASPKPLTAIEPVRAALALVRMASFETPVLFSGTLFTSATTTAEKLGTPVIRV